jgi:hypothetical protein
MPLVALSTLFVSAFLREGSRFDGSRGRLRRVKMVGYVWAKLTASKHC